LSRGTRQRSSTSRLCGLTPESSSPPETTGSGRNVRARSRSHIDSPVKARCRSTT
jgi:hypothetical protein